VMGFNITKIQEFWSDVFKARDIAKDGSQFDKLVKDGEVIALVYSLRPSSGRLLSHTLSSTFFLCITGHQAR
jgi:hypothetical protein